MMLPSGNDAAQAISDFFDKKKIHISEELKKIANKELPETDRRFLCYLFYNII